MSAATGLRAWIVQRVSAIYLALFVLYALIAFVSAEAVSYDAWRDWLARPFVNIAVGLFFLALFLHAWVGVRDVFMDYIRHTGWRFAVLSIYAALLIALGLWVARILVGVTS